MKGLNIYIFHWFNFVVNLNDICERKKLEINFEFKDSEESQSVNKNL